MKERTMQADSVRKLLSLEGRVVIIAGAGGGGIGTTVTRMVAETGATVIAADRSQQSLNEHVVPLRDAGLSIVPITADSNDDAGIEAILKCADEAAGELYGLVTIIGGVPDRYWGPSTSLTREGMDDLLAYNLHSMYFLSQAVVRNLQGKRLGGSIVAISSISGLTATPYHIAYGAAKAAVNSVVKTMGLELANQGIRVNAVAPGAIATPTAAKAPDIERDRWAVPMARQGRAEEIASSVLYLLSDMSSYVTGQCLVVDGGVSLKWSHLDADNCPAYARTRSFLDK